MTLSDFLFYYNHPKSVENGYAKAQYNLALAYIKGSGVDVDHKKDNGSYLMAAGRGNAGVQNNVGMMLADGKTAAKKTQKN